ncbi:23S rRNA (adenine(1618)-N(6))-methyltransferase RlmF [uncultured Paraglaciecola sp.]|uniref:23S rRNA (adenine(1618)-N(6))-methyltransferase RlmF n=1 Tax=uncultured Paraglaciecola sp. TaxID=1765024 RepID=UPI0030DDC381|tara:strand:- start:3834 stop:4790 length:957 start_codon:yes stop_codon:yes gene_type:complete
MHVRNVHKDGYPMAALCEDYPALKAYLISANSGKQSVNFSQPDAVKALNAALLVHYYGIKTWDIPQGYLCPPVPGRADYIHGIADLLATQNGGLIPIGNQVNGLDVGIGANAIYPIIGSASYGWRFIGSDIDDLSVKSAKALASANSNLAPLLMVRKQVDKEQIFRGIIKPDEHFAFTMCNPPFHKSAEDAALGSNRKTKGLEKNRHKRNVKARHNSPLAAALNFSGTANELWCEGGELAFIQRMISQSIAFKEQVDWFTCLVSKSAHLKAIETSVNYYGARTFLKMDMGQGQKQSRFVAWTFQEKRQNNSMSTDQGT